MPKSSNSEISQAPENQFIEKYKSYFTRDTATSDLKLITNTKNLLIDLMLKLKNSTARNEEFIYVLFKLCSELRADLLNSIDFYDGLPIKYCISNIQILRQANRHHATASIYNLANQYEEAFELWQKFVLIIKFKKIKFLI